MSRRPFLGLLAIVAALVTAPLTISSLAQAPAPAASRGSASSTKSVRDLARVSPESVGISPERLGRIDEHMKRLVDEKQVAGLVTLLVRHGKVAHLNTVGRLDVSKPGPLRADSIFRIASMTKPVIGVAMMMLHEEGKWRLDDPVSRFIPGFRDLKVYTGSNGDGTPKLEDARRPMTMRELMTHTGGLGYTLSDANPVDKMLIQARVLNPRAPLQSMIDGLTTLPLKAQPGTRWAYSIGVDVQGYLVEQMSGMPLGEFLKSRLFDPLRMKDTGFYVPAENVARLSQVHTGGGAKLAPGPSRSDPTVVPLGPSGGGGLFSTAPDYARFCAMLLQGGQLDGVRVLAPRTVEMMRTNHVNPDALKTMGPGLGWGMDFQVVMDAAAAGEAVPDGTFSWWGILGTWFWLDPANDLAFIGMVQHQDTRVTRSIHALSRSLVYGALVE
jgi:CubicO group peptidase (beta-lactamase class C family)